MLKKAQKKKSQKSSEQSLKKIPKNSPQKETHSPKRFVILYWRLEERLLQQETEREIEKKAYEKTEHKEVIFHEELRKEFDRKISYAQPDSHEPNPPRRQPFRNPRKKLLRSAERFPEVLLSRIPSPQEVSREKKKDSQKDPQKSPPKTHPLRKFFVILKRSRLRPARRPAKCPSFQKDLAY